MKNIQGKQPSSDTRHIFGTQNDYAQMFQMIAGFNVSQIVPGGLRSVMAIFMASDSLPGGPGGHVERAWMMRVRVRIREMPFG